MPVITSYDPGTFCWIELQTHDDSEAKAFYGGVCGWDFVDEPIPDSEMVYTHCRSRGLEVAGMFELSPDMRSSGMPPAWNSYVAVASVDDAATRAGALGAAVVMGPADVGTAGRVAILRDPEGAVVGLWQAGEHIGAQLVNEPVSLSWNELATRDVDAAQRFYGALFGWTFETVQVGPIPYTEIHNGGRRNGGIIPIQPDWPADMPANWSIYLAVADCGATVESVRQHGGMVITEPRTIPAGTFALVQDSQGTFFSVMQLAAEPG